MGLKILDNSQLPNVNICVGNLGISAGSLQYENGFRLIFNILIWRGADHSNPFPFAGCGKKRAKNLGFRKQNRSKIRVL